jgi:hypothetical protein
VPINLSRGYDNAQAMIRALEAELRVKVSTSLSAQENAARTLGCRKVVIAQPYDAARARQRATPSGSAAGPGRRRLGQHHPAVWADSADAALAGRALIRQYPQAD